MSTNDHMKDLTKEVVSTLKNVTAEKQQRVLTLFKSKLSDVMVHPEGPAFLTSSSHPWLLPVKDLQRVPQVRAPQGQQRVAPNAEQRVGTTPKITTFQDLWQVSNAPPNMNAPNPTTKRALKSTKRIHRRITWHMQSLLCPRNTSVSHIRLGRAIPPTLPGPTHVNK